MKLKYFRFGRLFIGISGFINRHLKTILFITISLFFLIIGLYLFKTLKHFDFGLNKIIQITKPPEDILDHTNDRTNFLILGIRGEGSDAPDLTDSMLLISYHFPSHQATVISIPRDLWVDSLRAKINTAYHYGNKKQTGDGISLTTAAIMETLGLPVHYTAVVNFVAFEDVINYLGGIDININPGFVDNLYPIPGKETVYPETARYETIIFATGSAHLDGQTALKYVRSRHALGDEGTDFARNRRQQQVISAIRDQLFSTKIIFNQKKIDDLLSIAHKNIITNITPDTYPALIRVGLDSGSQPIKHINISSETDEKGVTILENPPTKDYQGQWVLIAKDNNWKALQQYINNKLNGTQ